ncbi:hypothetical protein [Streptomyces albireticuli]|uniref:hypothetical protein n=1 Tax=Streptomyces albireticuli TaxID=1940 RepID=UPI001E35F1DE|nr:hypothetical protein [Streptomyces albireticuli]MCD9145633.1 hypothetical protein [Streptomyces albireticuli]MCD9165635.1 hypothetical protein [Streptomyces albireticuli]MCD9196310.1 hypothetical protein [Streptomyces albireticuli]
MHPEYLVGRRLEQVVASWHLYGSKAPSGPLDVWLIDSGQVSTHVTTGSDWCLTVERSAPYASYDMAESGRVEVAPVRGRTPFADHLGETVRAVSEERDPNTGRVALEIAFDSGRVRCDAPSGNLRLSSN